MRNLIVWTIALLCFTAILVTYKEPGQESPGSLGFFLVLLGCLAYLAVDYLRSKLAVVVDITEQDMLTGYTLKTLLYLKLKAKYPDAYLDVDDKDVTIDEDWYLIDNRIEAEHNWRHKRKPMKIYLRRV